MDSFKQLNRGNRPIHWNVTRECRVALGSGIVFIFSLGWLGLSALGNQFVVSLDAQMQDAQVAPTNALPGPFIQPPSVAKYHLPLGASFEVQAEYHVETPANVAFLLRPHTYKPVDRNRTYRSSRGLPLTATDGVKTLFLASDVPAEVNGLDFVVLDLNDYSVLYSESIEATILWGEATVGSQVKEAKGIGWFVSFGQHAERDADLSMALSRFTKAFELSSGKDAYSFQRFLAVRGLTRVHAKEGRHDESLSYAKLQPDLLETANRNDLLPAPSQANYLNLRLLSTLAAFRAQWRIGRLAECDRLRPSIERQILELIDATGSPPDVTLLGPLLENSTYAVWEGRRMLGDYFTSLGRSENADKMYSSVTDVAEPLRKKFSFTMNTRATVAKCFIGRTDLALEKRDFKLAAYLSYRGQKWFSHHSANRTRKATLDFYRRLALMRLGEPTDEGAYALAKDRLLNSVLHNDRIEAQRLLGRVHRLAGRYEEAIDAFTLGLSLEQKSNLLLDRTLLLTRRGEAWLRMNALAEAETDLIAALATARSIGMKSAEPQIYRLYAELRWAQGHYAEAMRLLDDAVTSAVNIGKPYLVPELCALYNKWSPSPVPSAPRDRWPELADALDEAGVPTTHSPADIAISPSPEMQDPIVGQDRTRMAIQPAFTRSIAEPGEFVRSFYYVLNNSDAATSVVVRLSGKSAQASWAPVEDGFVATITPTDEPHDFESEQVVSIQAWQSCNLELSGTTLTQSRRSYSLSLPGAGTQAKWEWWSLPDQPATSIVGASALHADPFHYIPFTHTLVCRNGEDTTIDVKVLATQPCRIECYSRPSHQLLFVDQQGNGSFAESGDVIYNDRNNDGFPDILLPCHSATDFILYVYPDHELSEEVLVNLYTRSEGTDWVAETIDILFPEEP